MRRYSDIIASVEYWEQNARWYQLWADHSGYHEPIIRHLMVNIQPHWRILDIGAGNGVLSLPLAALGCMVTALEPSSAMRRLFFQNAWRWGIGHVTVDERLWCDFAAASSEPFDLAVACNSLHVCGSDQEDTFRMLAALNPRIIFIATEKGADRLPEYAGQHGYLLCWTTTYQMQSPHVYHSLHEAYEHWRFGLRAGLMNLDERQFASRLRLSEDHWFFDETVAVSLFWWIRSDAV